MNNRKRIIKKILLALLYIGSVAAISWLVYKYIAYIIGVLCFLPWLGQALAAGAKVK